MVISGKSITFFEKFLCLLPRGRDIDKSQTAWARESEVGLKLPKRNADRAHLLVRMMLKMDAGPPGVLPIVALPQVQGFSIPAAEDEKKSSGMYTKQEA